MDELTMVQAVLTPPPPPGPQVTAAARQRLLARAGRGAGRRPLPARPARPRRRRWALALSGAVTAGLAGALAVASLLLGAGAQHGPGGLITSERGFAITSGRPAGPFLTAVAARVARARPGTGRYWCQSSVRGNLLPIGPKGRELTPAGEGEKPSPLTDYRYSIYRRYAIEDCYTYSATGSSNAGSYYQDLGARPATGADAAAWRREGSPAWHAWYGNGQLIPARPGPRAVIPGKGKIAGPSDVQLPTDPAKLRKALMYGDIDRRGSRVWDENLLTSALGALQEPLPPAVRAAVYRVMATIPGLHMRRGVTAPSGQTGTAVWIGASPAAGYSIIDPHTGFDIADLFYATGPHGVYAPGTLVQYFLWQPPGWTNRAPR